MGHPALEVEKLVKDFVTPMTRRKIRAVNELSFKVEEGHIVGFLGANGAGKTTTMKMIMRLIFADSGSVKIFGQENTNIDLKEKIGFLTERPYFYDYLTGREFLRFCAQLFRNPEALKRVDPLLEEVGLSHAADRQLRRYSKGMLQRVGIAQALVNNPRFVILDEPMSGLDPDGRAEMVKIIESCHKNGATVLFSTHLLNDVETICDRVVMINKGKLIVDESVSNLMLKHTSGYLLETRTASTGFRELLKQNFKTDDELQRAVGQTLKTGDKIIRVQPSRPSLEEIFIEMKREAP